jgi:hypothetical protein
VPEEKSLVPDQQLWQLGINRVRDFAKGATMQEEIRGTAENGKENLDGSP